MIPFLILNQTNEIQNELVHPIFIGKYMRGSQNLLASYKWVMM
jgi:hypothetical protein